MTSTRQHPAVLDEAALLSNCETRRQRRSGPGGQHRNKVETAIVITHLPTGIQGQAAERRSQEQNRKIAVHRLRVNLAVQHRTVLAVENFLASDLWCRRCQGQRVSVSPQHEDFPAILAEALNVVAACEWEPKEAARLLKCSPSQLIRLIQIETNAFVELNCQRMARGLRPLR